MEVRAAAAANTKLEEEQCFVSERLPKQQQQSVGCKRKRGSTAKERISQIPPSAAGKRSSIYRGVTRHRWTGRFEAHLWDKGTWNHAQNKKGKQVYLGAYDDEEAAARAYDLAALKYWGPGAQINFPVTDYSRDIDEMQTVTREEYLASLRRKSSGSGSKYRAVTSGRWDGGRLLENKYVCLDASEYKSLNIFDLSRFLPWLRPAQGSNNTGDSSNAEAHSRDEFIDEILQVDTNQGETGSWHSREAEPYQLPSLGLQLSRFKKKRRACTALGLVLQSSMFQQMLSKSCSQQKYVDGGGEWYRNDDDCVYTARHLLPTSSQKGEDKDGVGNSLSLWNTAFTASLLTNTITSC